MAKKKAPQPRRTREHVIASQSYNYVEKFFIDKGHTIRRQTEDYGIDLVVVTFDEQGYAESGDIRLQVKASDSLKYSGDGTYIAFTIDAKHYESWTSEPMPVFLVLYDAQARKAFWLYVQEHFGADLSRKPKRGAKSVTVRVPVANELTEATVDYARQRKELILRQMEGRIEHHG
ncbi:MAG TPA: DUF4365 domain-containing protein [Gemmataceae bacterium]|nr:DUF4365 domain-containing protein [Gemmataceae bacterium]